MKLTIKDIVYIFSIIAIIIFMAHDKIYFRAPLEILDDDEVVYKGGYDREEYDKAGVDPPYPEPLAGVISDPEKFFEHRVITSGYLRLHSPDSGRLYLNKDDAENFIYINAIFVSDLNESLDIKLDDFDNRYVTIVGVVYSYEKFPAMKKIDGIWDLEKLATMRVKN